MSLKTYLLTLCLSCFTLFAYAQPVLTTESQTPTIGETYEVQYAEVTVFDPGPGGVNQTWDFSDVELNSFEMQFSILAPGDGVSNMDFPDADFVWRLDAFDAYNYYQATDTGLDLVGGASGTEEDIIFLEIFSDTEDGLQLPLTYEGMYTYYSAFTSYFFGTSFNDERNGSVDADGYGTLVLPDGTTYNNVLRIIITSSTTAFSVTETQYAWMLPGQFVPLMVYTFDDSGESIPSVYYSKRNLDTSVRSFPNVDLGLRIQQNPVPDQLQLLGASDILSDLEIQVVDGLGRVQLSVRNKQQLDVQLLPNGTYFLVARHPDGQQVIPFVKQ